jgi:hypothetical protein
VVLTGGFNGEQKLGRGEGACGACSSIAWSMVGGARGVVLAETREAAEKDACGCRWRHLSANVMRVTLAEWLARCDKKQEQAALALTVLLSCKQWQAWSFLA